VFTRARVLVDAEQGPRVRTMLRNTLLAIRVVNSIRSTKASGVSRAASAFLRLATQRTKRQLRTMSFVKRTGGELASLAHGGCRVLAAVACLSFSVGTAPMRCAPAPSPSLPCLARARPPPPALPSPALPSPALPQLVPWAGLTQECALKEVCLSPSVEGRISIRTDEVVEDSVVPPIQPLKLSARRLPSSADVLFTPGPSDIESPASHRSGPPPRFLGVWRAAAVVAGVLMIVLARRHR
jgi:hypothetical protein